MEGFGVKPRGSPFRGFHTLFRTLQKGVKKGPQTPKMTHFGVKIRHSETSGSREIWDFRVSDHFWTHFWTSSGQPRDGCYEVITCAT